MAKLPLPPPPHTHRKDPENLDELMAEIVSELRPPNFFTEFDDDVLAIQVRRGGVLITDALREGGKRKFVPEKKLKVWDIVVFMNAQCIFRSRLSLLWK